MKHPENNKIIRRSCLVIYVIGYVHTTKCFVDLKIGICPRNHGTVLRENDDWLWGFGVGRDSPIVSACDRPKIRSPSSAERTILLTFSKFGEFGLRRVFFWSKTQQITDSPVMFYMCSDMFGICLLDDSWSFPMYMVGNWVSKSNYLPGLSTAVGAHGDTTITSMNRRGYTPFIHGIIHGMGTFEPGFTKL